MIAQIFSNLFLELVPDYNTQWPIKKKFEALIKAIQKIAEKLEKTYAVLIDEMPPSFLEACPDYGQFLQSLQAKCKLVHVFLAFSPSGRNLNKPITFVFKEDKIFAKQLKTRHRNSFLLSIFLIHITYNYNKMKHSESKFQCLSPEMDAALDSSLLPEGDITLWYNKSENITDVEILEFLYKTYLPDTEQVLVSPRIQDLSHSVYDWCLNKKWDVVSHEHMTGSERDLVIAFAGDNFGNLEVLSRARKRLIIITK